MNEVPPLTSTDAQASVEQKTSQAAIWSLVLGILSNLCLWLLGSIPAIILGIVAIKNVNRNPAAVGGKGLAIAGIITGSIGMASGAVMASMLFIGAAAYQKGAGRAKCILTMATAQKLAISHANLNNLVVGDSLPASVFVDEGYVETMFACPEGGTYTFLEKVPDEKTSYIKCDQEGHVLDFGIYQRTR
ncbi:MAG: DUF4190 domain-containing protein [Verrucomicrobia bacterium]|nr:DUF4190 domain-containing protein [Verrucomicrobiota bacterium]